MKTETDWPVVLSPTPVGETGKPRPEITKVLQGLVEEEKVAADDVTKLALYRRGPFAWASLANEGHPALTGRILLAERMAPF